MLVALLIVPSRYAVTWPMLGGVAVQKDYNNPKGTVYITEVSQSLRNVTYNIILLYYPSCSKPGAANFACVSQGQRRRPGDRPKFHARNATGGLGEDPWDGWCLRHLHHNKRIHAHLPARVEQVSQLLRHAT